MFTHYFKVGLGVIIAAVILFYAYTMVQENRLGKNEGYTLTVLFDNVEGLTTGNAVWLSGLKIGSVNNMELLSNGKVKLTLLIDKKYKIQKGSTFSIRVGILQDEVLSIEKPAVMEKPYKYYKNTDVVTNAESPVTLQSLVGQADTAMKEVNKILVNTRQFTENEQIKRDILETMSNVAQTTEEAREFAKALNDTAATNRGSIEDTLANVETISQNLITTTDKLDDLISHVNDIVGDESIKKEIKDSMSDLKDTMDNLKESTKSIRDVVTDDELKTNVKETVKSTRATMENADVAFRGFTKMIKAVNETEIDPDFDFRYETHLKQYFADMNLRIFPPGKKVYYLIGLDNLGESGKTNLQFAIAGNKPETWYRFGIKNGKLGIGAERTRKNMFYQAELIDPNDLQLDLRGGRELWSDAYLMLGWERVFKKDGLSLGILQRY